MKYPNRYEAGKVLAENLRAYVNKDNVIVLGLPRGGVPVAYEVAKALGATLDVFVVRKLGVPGHNELAMGAIASGGVRVFNRGIIDNLNITDNEIDVVTAVETQELERREKLYRKLRALPSLRGKVVILVDDGIATGATMRAAITALRELDIDKCIVAVPVAQKTLCQELQYDVDKFICPMQVDELRAVGKWYDDFSQTEDDEVSQLLKDADDD